jgi:hypothetical protein
MVLTARYNLGWVVVEEGNQHGLCYVINELAAYTALKVLLGAPSEDLAPICKGH